MPCLRDADGHICVDVLALPPKHGVCLDLHAEGGGDAVTLPHCTCRSVRSTQTVESHTLMCRKRSPAGTPLPAPPPCPLILRVIPLSMPAPRGSAALIRVISSPGSKGLGLRFQIRVSVSSYLEGGGAPAGTLTSTSFSIATRPTPPQLLQSCCTPEPFRGEVAVGGRRACPSMPAPFAATLAPRTASRWSR